MTSRRGFSLIELLVVVSIIALLLGITIPTLSIARNKAQQTACAAKLYGLGQGVQIYRQDHNEVFPEARYMPYPWLTGQDETQDLPTAVKEYLEPNTSAWVCPADRLVHNQTWIDEGGIERECGTSYAYVAALSAQAYEDTFFARFLRFSPSDTPVMHDYDGGTFEREDGGTVLVDPFHPKRQILFVDGHVGSIGGQ
jgi:prepilin-type N-terminal cleavage/methylation domain-containing protein/prepilin-type processing-associated H-X9-DG protein